MSPPDLSDHAAEGVHLSAPAEVAQALKQQWLQQLAPYVDSVDLQFDAIEGGVQRLRLSPGWIAQHASGFDTLNLSEHLRLDPAQHPADTQAEILLAMLCCPVPLPYPSVAELDSAVHMRQHIADAARRTAVAFKTDAAERPAAYWHEDDEHGFVLNDGVDLIDALVHTTQPSVTGQLYDFSCYRASEYVILLGMARELQRVNPPLYAALAAQCRRRVIRSGAFHDVFVTEYGRNDAPLPPRFAIPGDRLWFRNPDERSANATGYEGSWVIYLGGGLFSNFWKVGAPFTLQGKCLEIFHWRDGAFTDANGEVQMDEAIVESRVAQTLKDPAAVAHIMDRMLRLRDLQGVYADGGCIDRTREYPRWVRPDSPPFALPALP